MGQLVLPRKTGRDYRWPVALLVVGVTVVLGYVFDRISEQSATADHRPLSKNGAPLIARDFDQLQPAQLTPEHQERELPSLSGAADVPPPADDNPQRLLAKGRKEVDQKRYDEALATLAQAIQRKPQFPEAYTAGGFALLGKKLPDNARTAFLRAINMNPGLADAYFGLGFALEALGDSEAALGAMRSYIHLTPVKDPYNKTVVTARSAIWEMESRLGRGPWGATGGIPPGLTEAEVRRDGNGAGMMTPLPDGTSRAQVRPPSAMPKKGPGQTPPPSLN